MPNTSDTSPRRLSTLICSTFALAFCLSFTPNLIAQSPPVVDGQPRVVLAHYMPWYMAKPFHAVWGWHWTMNHFDPEKPTANERSLASHFTPRIGAYDSGDPVVLEYQLLTMKTAGIDGVIVDWYGLQDFRDYRFLHENTLALVTQLQRFGMKFIICYEDQTVPALIEAGKLPATERVAHVRRELTWMSEHWFSLPNYVRLDNKPVLLSFGQTGLTDAEWTECLTDLKPALSYFSLHQRRQSALGAFDWPLPSEGIAAVDRFHQAASKWPAAIPVVFPRFKDIYAQAQVGKSYGEIPDRDGATFRDLLRLAYQLKSPIIQIATWNDWGEGTIVEPSKEFGNRDLQVLQSFRSRYLDHSFQATQADLELVFQLYQARRAEHAARQDARIKQLDDVARLISAGNYAAARAVLQQKDK